MGYPTSIDIVQRPPQFSESEDHSWQNYRVFQYAAAGRTTLSQLTLPPVTRVVRRTLFFLVRFEWRPQMVANGVYKRYFK